VIMLQVKTGDLDKMGLLFERYHRALHGFLYHMTNHRESSEDMVQMVFYRMLKYRHTFKGDGEFKSWMYHLARNVLKDHVKKNKKTINHYDVVEFEERIAGGTQADEQIQKEQELRVLQNALTNLSPENKEVLVLSRFQELKYSEIAKIMDITEGTVKVRVHRAMNQLKEIYLKIENQI
jgi:RNA polymerase sigma-70 factor, ECF subfamily